MNRQEQYLGNPNLKKGHTPSRFSKKQIEEVLKCMNDPKYFISKNKIELDSNIDLENLFSIIESKYTHEDIIKIDGLETTLTALVFIQTLTI